MLYALRHKKTYRRELARLSRGQAEEGLTPHSLNSVVCMLIDTDKIFLLYPPYILLTCDYVAQRATYKNILQLSVRFYDLNRLSYMYRYLYIYTERRSASCGLRSALYIIYIIYIGHIRFKCPYSDRL